MRIMQMLALAGALCVLRSVRQLGEHYPSLHPCSWEKGAMLTVREIHSSHGFRCPRAVTEFADVAVEGIEEGKGLDAPVEEKSKSLGMLS